MTSTLIFDAIFADENNVGQAVDSDIYVELYAGDDAVTPKETRTLGSDASTEIVQTSSGAGIFYTTSVDVSGYFIGPVTAKWYSKSATIPVDPYPFIEVLTYPTSGDLNETSIREYIRSMLGWPAVGVELQPGQYAHIMEEALGYYNQYVPVEQTGVVNFISGVYKYNLPDVPSRGVYRVEFVRAEGAPLVSDPLFGREYPRGQQLDFDQYNLGISIWKTIQRTTGQEPDWKWDRLNKDLYISLGGTNVNGPSGSFLITYHYFDDNALSQVPQMHFRALRRYCLALAKEVLAQIRGKFGGAVPAPGGQLTLNASELMQQSENEKEKMENEIRGFSPPVPPTRW